jgi:hypothetical protein
MQIRGDPVAIADLFCQAALDDPPEHCRHSRVEGRDVLRFVVDDGVQRGGRRVPVERLPPGGHLEQDQTE